ncbi:MAG TPA: hypothetical protein VG367_17110 [Mucilaginibacter sp.]|jgi:hypothetical protein|nr:hypothetical protein [Mucilaginibacter sp.]
MEPGLVKQFTIGPDGLRSIKNRSLINALVMLPFIVVPCLLSDTGTYTINGVRQPQFDSNLVGAIIMTGIFFITVFIGLRQLVAKYRQYTIRLNYQLIEKRGLANQKIVIINVVDIKGITRRHDGSFYIYSSNSAPLFIPKQMENREELETTLIALNVPFSTGPYGFFLKTLKSHIFSRGRAASC